jgi:hypothetical protein
MFMQASVIEDKKAIQDISIREPMSAAIMQAKVYGGLFREPAVQ